MSITQVGSSVAMTKSGEVTWNCIAANESGIVLADPAYDVEQIASLLSPDFSPREEDLIDHGIEGTVYAAGNLALKIYDRANSEGITGLPWGGALPDIKANVGLHHGLEVMKPIVDNWRVEGPTILGAFVPHEALIDDPDMIHPGGTFAPIRWLMKKIPARNGFREHPPLRAVDAWPLLEKVSECYSLYPIHHDYRNNNQLVTRRPGRFLPGRVTLIDNWALGNKPI